MSKTGSLCLLLALILAACHGAREVHREGAAPVASTVAADAVQMQVQQQVSAAMAQGYQAYRLVPGDTLSVDYFFDNSKAERYTLGIGDTMTVDFRTHPEYTRRVVVRPDGRISLPGIGPVMAVGRSPEQLAAVVANAYNDVLINPQVTVIVESFNSRSSDLMKMVAGLDQKRSTTVLVEPDGSVNLPLLPPLKAAGLPLTALTQSINTAYHSQMANVSTSLRISQLSSNSVFVFGEVKTPGPVNASGARTVLQLVAAAGGPTPQAATTQVRVVSYDAQLQPVVSVVDLNALMASGAGNFTLPPNSTIYVPPSGLAKMGRTLDMAMGGVLRFTGVGVSVSR